ncbi:TPA: hypothetical protein ACH3X1_016474 [Trebouxia sp. C0004]
MALLARLDFYSQARSRTMEAKLAATLRELDESKLRQQYLEQLLSAACTSVTEGAQANGNKEIIPETAPSHINVAASTPHAVQPSEKVWSDYTPCQGSSPLPNGQAFEHQHQLMQKRAIQVPASQYHTMLAVNLPLAAMSLL